MIIAFSGKLSTGKTSLAKEVCKILNIPGYHSFGNVIREGTAREYDFDKNLATTQEGKLTVLPCGLTVREAMQEYGRNMRAKDPDFILNSVKEHFESLYAGIFVIDDIRMPEEHAWIRSVPGSIIIRMEPNEDWMPGPYSGDKTETALDDCEDWDLQLSLPYVLQDKSFVPLTGHAMAVAGVSYAKMASILSRMNQSQEAQPKGKSLSLNLPIGLIMDAMSQTLKNTYAPAFATETVSQTLRP